MLRGQGLGRSVSSVEGEVAARGLAKLEARVCTSSWPDQCATSDGFSRTRSLFLRARHGRGRPGDCRWTGLGPTGQTPRSYRRSAVATAL
jgi:hypothetical protein